LFAIHGLSVLAKIGVALGLAVALGTGASGAGGSSLSVKVVPSTVHPGTHYAVTITGIYDKHAVAHAPYLLAFIQYTGKRCRRTATAEYRLPGSEWDWDYRQHAEHTSPFTVVTHWTAGPSLGIRHVCAYLYADRVSPSSHAKPLLRVSASFRNSRAPAKRTH
jgi:hypothetical protein